MTLRTFTSYCSSARKCAPITLALAFALAGCGISPTPEQLISSAIAACNFRPTPETAQALIDKYFSSSVAGSASTISQIADKICAVVTAPHQQALEGSAPTPTLDGVPIKGEFVKKGTSAP